MFLVCYTPTMDKPWMIYGLEDPRTGDTRYVGATFRGNRRLNEHMSRAVTGGRTHRDCWIRSLITMGLRPTLKVLEQGAGEGWQDREKFWIAEHRLTGDLVNHTDGGEGFLGYVPTPELRAKWSAMRRGVPYAPGRVPGMKGKHHTPEVREKIREASTGLKRTEETRKRMSDAAKIRGMEAALSARRKRVVCVETGESFESLAALVRSLKVNRSTISQAIRNGSRCKGNHYKYG